jgi:uncharacterized membrane protein YoaK (UPF0700 family)
VSSQDIERGRGKGRPRALSLGGRDVMVLMLTWAAGSVDAISYLGLGRVFTANMTGNAVLLGLAIGQGQGFAALRSVVALAGFAIGAAIGAMIVERAHKGGDWPPGVTAALAVEGVVLGIFALAWHFPWAVPNGGVVYALIALSAVAMGIQSAAIRHLNVPGIATTYITGTLTSFVAGLVGWIGAADLSSAAKSPEGAVAPASQPPQRKHTARLQAAVFIIYVLAAVASSIIQARRPALVTLAPLVAVALVVANGSVRHRRRQLTSQ